MNNEKILKIKKLIDMNLKNRQCDLLETQRVELKNMIQTDFKNGKIEEEEYIILEKYIDDAIDEILDKIKETKISKKEQDFIKKFKETVMRKMPLLTKEEAYQMVLNGQICESPQKEIVVRKENKAQEFRKKIEKESKKAADEKSKDKRLRVIEVRNGVNEEKYVNKRSSEDTIISKKNKNKESRIDKKAEAYNGSMINLKSKEQEEKGEEK